MSLTKEIAGRWLAGARGLFLPIALGFLVYSAYRSSAQLMGILNTLSLPHLLLAWLFWGGAQWIGPLATLAFAHILDLPLNYRELSLVAILRIPAKYLPGGIWQSVARFSAYRQLDISRADSLVILVAEHLLALSASVMLGSVLLLYLEGSGFLYGIAVWMLAGSLVLLAVTALGVKKKIEGNGVKAVGGVLMAMLASALFWMAAAASFYMYWVAIFGLHSGEMFRVVSCYLLAWAAGFVALFAPQGIGVFEWVGSHLLPSEWPLSTTAVVFAGFRIVTIIADLTVWSIGFLVSWIYRLDCAPDNPKKK